MMPPNVQEQVVKEGFDGTTPIDQIEVVPTLGARMGKGQSPELKQVVLNQLQIFNWFDKEEGKELLKSNEKGIPNLVLDRAENVRFEDLVDLVPAMSVRSLRKLIRMI